MVDAHPLPLTTRLHHELLYLVTATGPATPDELIVELREERSDPIPDPQVREALATLVDADYIDNQPIDMQTTTYQLTEKGWDAVIADLKWRFHAAEQGRDR